MPPSDRLKRSKAKMEEWIGNKVQLGWLFDLKKKTVHIYRPAKPPEIRTGLVELAGEGPLEGFVLDLRRAEL